MRSLSAYSLGLVRHQDFVSKLHPKREVLLIVRNQIAVQGSRGLVVSTFRAHEGEISPSVVVVAPIPAKGHQACGAVALWRESPRTHLSACFSSQIACFVLPALRATREACL